MMPVSWTKTYQLPGGKKGKCFNTTMGASQDLKAEGSRRMMINSVYWSLGLKVPSKSKVDLVGKSNPMNKFKHGAFTKGVKPNDHQIK